MNYYYIAVGIGITIVIVFNLLAWLINRRRFKEEVNWLETHNKEARDFDELMKKNNKTKEFTEDT